MTDETIHLIASAYWSDDGREYQLEETLCNCDECKQLERPARPTPRPWKRGRRGGRGGSKLYRHGGRLLRYLDSLPNQPF